MELTGTTFYLLNLNEAFSVWDTQDEATQYLRDELLADINLIPTTVTLYAIDAVNYRGTEIPMETVVRAVLWADLEYP